MSAPAIEVVFLKPRLSPQAQSTGIVVVVAAEEPRVLHRPAPFVVKPVRS